MLGQSLLKRVLGGKSVTKAPQKAPQKPTEALEIIPRTKSLATSSLPEVAPQIEVVHQDVKDMVDKIIFSDSDISRVSHLFRELMQLHDVKGEILTGTTSVSVNLKGEPKKSIPLEKICLGILKDFPEAEYNREGYSSDTEIKFKHFSIKLTEESYPTRVQLVIKMSKSMGEKELTLLKEVFEKNIFKNCNFASGVSMDEEFISDRLGLRDTDIVILEAQTLKIKKFTEENAQVDISEMLVMAGNMTLITKYQATYFINIHPDVSSYLRTSHQHFNIAVTGKDMSDIIAFDLIIEKKSIAIHVALPNNSFDRKFVTSFLVPFTKEVQQLVTAKNQESITEYLQKMGVQVQENTTEDQRDLKMLYEREGFMGYEDIKDHIENGIIHAWKNKAKFEEIAREKFKNIKDIVPNAVLFEGPAGTGKTTLARIIGSHLNYPFVYIPLNSFMSKWYGEAEQRLAKIFEKIGELAKQKGGVVIMIDEIDEIGGDREKSHEATGKITGVLLKKLDGMERIDNILLIGATNRKDMLDTALLSRFKYSQFFRLPNEGEILQIVTHYLPDLIHISPASFTPFVGKISGRNLKNICEDTTRIAIQNEIDGKEIDLTEIFLKSLARSVES